MILLNASEFDKIYKGKKKGKIGKEREKRK